MFRVINLLWGEYKVLWGQARYGRPYFPLLFTVIEAIDYSNKRSYIISIEASKLYNSNKE